MPTINSDNWRFDSGSQTQVYECVAGRAEITALGPQYKIVVTPADNRQKREVTTSGNLAQLKEMAVRSLYHSE